MSAQMDNSQVTITVVFIMAVAAITLAILQALQAKEKEK